MKIEEHDEFKRREKNPLVNMTTNGKKRDEKNLFLRQRSRICRDTNIQSHRSKQFFQPKLTTFREPIKNTKSNVFQYQNHLKSNILISLHEILLPYKKSIWETCKN